MNPDQARDSYNRAPLENVYIRRYTAGRNARFDWSCKALVRGFVPQEIVSGSSINQGDRRVILLYEDLIKEGFPLPLLPTDALIIRGKEVAINAIDDSTRRIGSELIAYDVHVRG